MVVFKASILGIWLGIFFLLLLAFVPFRLRDKFAGKLGIWIGHKAKKQRTRAQTNLQYCFPHWTEQQREQVIDKMFTVVTQVMFELVRLQSVQRNICKNEANLSVLNISNRQKLKERILFLWCHMAGRLMRLALFCTLKACQ